jgi:protein arginine kinase activator
MLACPHCYQAFENEIITSLKKVQGKTFHVGKTPKIVGLDRELLNEYDRLIKEKEDATLDGRYSRINELSQEILDLAEELKRRGIL